MRLMELPPETRVYPATPTRRRSAASGRRTRSSGSGAAQAEGTGALPGRRPRGDDRRVVADYDGKGKGWVRFDDGTGRIMGGSRVDI